jgi:glycosyltransferase involved in cell wall biosynthesis
MAIPELSVVIPVFGRQEEVQRAVRSVLSQDVDLEVLVVDDGSPTPISLELPRVKVLRHGVNKGAAAARNAGVAAARTDWIAFLDSDDVWPAGSLRPRLEAARRVGAPTTIWTSAFTYIWPDGRKETRIPRPASRAIHFASGCWTCPGSTALFSTEVWRQSGGQDPALRRLEDYEWLIRWGLGGGCVSVFPNPGAEVHRGVRPSPESVLAAASHIRARHSGSVSMEIRRRIESYLQLEIAAARLGQGDVFSGALALARSIWLKPRISVALEPLWGRANT